MANPIKYTLATNLVTYSEDFTNANWGKSNVSVTGDTTSSPIGTSTADSLIENSVVLTQHAITKSITSTAGNIYTYSIYLKSNSRSSSAVWMFDSSYTNGFGGNFNLTASTVTNLSQGTGVSSGVNQITNVGNGWYRCSITGKIPTVTSFNLGVYLLNNSGVSNYTGDGTSNMYIWGAQLEKGSVATTYIATTTSTVTVNATQSNSIKTSNFAIGVNKGGYGPTNITNFYNGKTANVGGYTVYVNNNGSGSPSPFVASNDAALITLSNQLGGSGITTIAAALNFFNASSTMLCTNMDYPNIVTSGLVLNLDAAYTPSYPKGLTAWTDLSGNGNNGILVNGPSYSSTDGGNIIFNGTNSYINCGNPANLQTFSQITLNTWVKFSGLDYVNNTGSLVTFIDKGQTDSPPGTPSSGFWFSYENRLNRNSFNYTCFGNTTGGYAGGGNSFGSKTYTFTNGVWYNITATVNSSSQGALFINGVQQGTSITFTNLNLSNTTNNLQVGMYLSNNFFLNGNISQTQIYNRALSEAEVLQNYYAGLQRFIPTDSLVLSLDGDNTDKQVTTASTAYDMSGNNNNGTLGNGVALVSDGQRSFSFDGTNDYILLSRPVQDDFTLSCWFKTGQFGTLQTQWYNGYGLVDCETGGVHNDFGLSISGGRILFGIGNPDITIYSPLTYNDSIWHYVVCTRLKSTGAMTLYVDSTSVATGTGQTASLTYATNMTIGSLQTNSNFFNGKVAQVQVYSRALTATEVSTIYTATKSRYGL